MEKDDTIIDTALPAPLLWRAWRSDLARDFRQSPIAQAAAALLLAIVLGAVLAPWIAPTNPYDLATLSLLDSRLPPIWLNDGRWPFVLGTDSQGADLLSLILYGVRTSLLVAVAAAAMSCSLGTLLGLFAGYFGGWVGSVIMRAADIQFTFPAILLAMLIGGIGKAVLPASVIAELSLTIVVIALGVSHWPHFARLVRGAVLVEKGKDYVAAARLIGRSNWSIMFNQLLPNVINVIFVMATLDIAFAVMGEATLSFLGLGLPPTQPSLGTLIRTGYGYLFSGEWWLVIFPSVMLLVLVIAINLIGDWLRDALNPRLKQS